VKFYQSVLDHIRSRIFKTTAVENMRILYFDIDGVFLSYEEEQRPILAGGAFQDRLKTLGFSRLVCVSGWSDIINSGLLKNPEREQKLTIHSMLKDIFPDEEWFLSRLVLAYDTDHRCKHIDLSENWFYIDDWAEKFFQEQFGEQLYKREIGRRILLVDPHSDGGDILRWLDTVVSDICK